MSNFGSGMLHLHTLLKGGAFVATLDRTIPVQARSIAVGAQTRRCDFSYQAKSVVKGQDEFKPLYSFDVNWFLVNLSV